MREVGNRSQCFSGVSSFGESVLRRSRERTPARSNPFCHSAVGLAPSDWIRSRSTDSFGRGCVWDRFAAERLASLSRWIALHDAEDAALGIFGIRVPADTWDGLLGHDDRSAVGFDLGEEL